MMRNMSTEIPEASVFETEKFELKPRSLISGFVGAGLVGQIAVSHMIEQMNMKEIAHTAGRTGAT